MSVLKGESMTDPIKDYARAVAEAVWHHARTFEVPDPPLWEELDAIIASVPPPTAQHHDAPTCDGWWWVSVHGGEWQMKCVVGKTVWQNAQGESWRMSYSGWNARWVGPLLPPDTTEPAPEVPEWSTCVLCGKQTERTEVACLDCQKYAVDLVRAPVAPPTPDIDIRGVDRARSAKGV